MTRPGEILGSVVAASEREQLETFLDYLRDAVVRKARGVSEEDARRSPVPTGTNLGGLVKHLRWVELGGFAEQIGQIPAHAAVDRRRPGGRPAAGAEREARRRHRRLPGGVRPLPRDRRPAQPRLRRHHTAGQGADVDVPARDRGDRPARGPRGHPARDDRRQRRRLTARDASSVRVPGRRRRRYTGISGG